MKLLAQSTVQPEKINVTKIGGKAKVRLTQNVEIITKDDEQLYQYDEVVFLMSNTQKLKESIEKNFELYFNFGVNYMKKEQGFKVREDEVKRLIEKQELPKELESLMVGIVEIYENLYLESLQNSLAIAEIYEIVLLGGGE